MESRPISVQFIVYESLLLTKNVYQESHTLKIDANGIIIVSIGEGITGDNFSTISWKTDNHFLNLKMNIGAELVDLGITEFKTVSYV